MKGYDAFFPIELKKIVFKKIIDDEIKKKKCMLYILRPSTFL